MSELNKKDPVENVAETQSIKTEDLLSISLSTSTEALPASVGGRYTIRGMLGQGGFGDVLLAYDEVLRRLVALKRPRADKFRSEKDLQSFLEEARTSAKLQHHGIVTVHDVGSYNDAPYIVLEYIRGRSLAQLLDEQPISRVLAATLVIEIAEAIGHAHERGFVHRDIKPQNILLDTSDHPHIADFGLAVKQWELPDSGDQMAGTSAYMAPEQVRGETHRIDARTDIWSLGVVFYLMLTRAMPFEGSTRHGIFQQILYTDPRPPSQRQPDTPVELERICMRCLSRQMTDRYSRAAELAADLQEWLELTAGNAGSSSSRRRPLYIEPPDAPVVPRGLRSFEREDGEFFLRLIPGPRDREGLPSAVRFWKNRVEEREHEQTFRVGVLYGPSGCGKSSLLKAGVLPRLSKQIASIHLDATPHDTGSRLFKALQKVCNQRLPPTNLDDALRRLRESDELRGGKKVLIVIDQFEQWLETWQSNSDDQLVNALRHCDGGNVQAILMVRDDFWLPLSRLMRALEIATVEGVNGMLVDSFDPEHSRRVMRELGVAYGRFAQNVPQTEEQQSFINQAIEGLTENNRLYPVRLSVFVEMVKDRPWVPATLSEMGGTEGVGVAFLETSVGGRASSSRRIHGVAIRQVLAALLPETGEIKDRVRTRNELLAAAQYELRPHDFETILRMLDNELRLITHSQPTDALVVENSNSDSQQQVPIASDNVVGEGVYQLTHDFLVPSIREWLQRQTRGSRKGRVQLLLQEQSGIWNSRPNSRYLPTLIEWLGILWQTSAREWTAPQRRMMRAATIKIAAWGTKLIAALCITIGLGLLIRQQSALTQARVLVSNLQKVDMVDVPDVIRELAPYRRSTDGLLRQQLNNADESLPRRARVALALLPSDATLSEWLAEQMLSEQILPSDWKVILGELKPHRSHVEPVWRKAIGNIDSPSNSRFRAGVAMSVFQPEAAFWEEHGPELVAVLLQQATEDAECWINLLQPVAENLCQPIHEAWGQINTPRAATVACQALSKLSSVDDLLSLLQTADGLRYRAVVDALKPNTKEAVKSLQVLYEAKNATHGDESTNIQQSVRYWANVCLAMWELGNDSALRSASQPALDPQLRTEIIHALANEQPLSSVHALLMDCALDDPCLNVALLSAAMHRGEPQSVAAKQKLQERLVNIYQQAPSCEAHTAAGLLLRKLGRSWKDLDQDLGTDECEVDNRDWMLTPSGLTLAIVRPGTIPSTESAAAPKYKFAISIVEIPRALFLQFDPKYKGIDSMRVDSDETPATNLLMIQMASFCNWLNERDKIIDPKEWCYPPMEEMTVANCHPFPDAESRLGYRICASQEWMLATGAGVITSRFYGESNELMSKYAWTQTQSGRLLHKVGELLPNPLGLFDVYGNAGEACFLRSNRDNENGDTTYETRGGESMSFEQSLSTQASAPLDPKQRKTFVGFRVVRTLRDQP